MSNNEEAISESMEMYLVSIIRLRKEDQPVPLSQLAEVLSVTPVSVNEMCRKLQDSGYLVYQPYKGAVLTDKGETFGNHVLRRHRLWQVFLIEKLHLSHEEADEAACALEHITTDEVTNHLDEFLGFPEVDPRGHAIPTSNGKHRQQATMPLSKVAVGNEGHILQNNAPEKVQSYLEQHGLHPGAIIRVIASGDKDLLVEVNHEQVQLIKSIAEDIYIMLSSSDEDEGIETIIQAERIDKQGNEVELQMESEKVNTIEKSPLNELKKGESGIIVQVGGKGAVKRRMMDMGVVPGSEISMVRVAPFGDPIEFTIKGYSLSLRKSEAKEILVEKIK